MPRAPNYISAGAYGDRYAGTYTIGVTEGTTPLVVPAPSATLDELADFLTDGFWSGRQYTFDTSSSNEITVNLTGLTADGRQLARWAMEAWELVADIEFVEVTSGEMITMDDEADGAFAFAPGRGFTTGGVELNVGTGVLGRYGTSIGSYSLQVYIHELGHTLGLGHQGRYNGRAVYGVDDTFSNDSWQMSVMSYFDQRENTGTNASYATLLGPMMADILAIQNLYGASDVTNGATTWGVGSNLPGFLGDFLDGSLSNSEYRGGPVAFTIFDNGGVDHINASSSMTDDRWDMREQHFSDVKGLIGTVGIAAGTAIEHLTSGSGNDTIIGNDLGNRINSGVGHDSINGGAGDDTIRSGTGDDSLDGGGGIDQARFRVASSDFAVIKDGDVYTIVSAEGVDRVTNVEEFVFGDTTLSATDLDARAGTITARDRLLVGGADNDTLTGGDGADTIHGGAGDNTIIGGDGNNLIFSGRGRDSIRSGAGDDTILSGADNDTIRSGDGDDSIDGGVGFDQARFSVAIGDVIVTKDGDTYIIVSAEGVDRVRNVEEFVFGDTTLGAAQMDARAGTITARDRLLLGGADNDTLTGGDGADTIHGGAGDNTIIGGAGNNLIFSGRGRDSITFGDDDDTIDSGDGNNRIWSGDGADTIRSGDGADSIWSGDGNNRIRSGAGDDSITTDDGENTINSGAGDDTITTGDGNNRIWSGDGDDSITTGDGSDFITTGDDNDSIFSGDGRDSIWSGAGDDTIRSGEGNDMIASGYGNDWIFGGAGADTFVFKRGYDHDEINDFELGTDTLRLSGGKSAVDIVSDYATITSGAVVFDFGGDDIITISNLDSLTGLSANIEIF